MAATTPAYQLNNGKYAVDGIFGGQDISNLGIPRPAGLNINKDITYSLALLATTRHQKRGRQFIDFLRRPIGQMVYTNSGFTGLTPDQLDGVKCYTGLLAAFQSRQTEMVTVPVMTG